MRPLTVNTQREPGDASADHNAESIREAVIASLEDDKAEDILVLDLEGKSTIADQMIIASGRSARHVAALAEHVQRKIKDLGGQRARVEGLPNADWVLIDTGDLIVHLFRPEVREFYDLERIWAGPAGQGHLRH
ncbi:MAG: ribosome silencing factor [Pseudomonadota bacterium]